jgi:ABC-type lipoprotein release transport system permease subunit
MKILLSISWRNIWRHPARSGVLMGAIVAGLWAGILVSGWVNGMVIQRVDRVINEELTHLQIHHPDFMAERESSMFISPADPIFDFLDRDERVASYTARTLADGMIQSPVTTSGVQIMGVNSHTEPQTTNFHENLIDGEYVDAEIRNPIVLGKQLSEKLNIGIGNRVVLSFQDINNELVSGAFNVTGIYETGQPSVDERKVYVRSDNLSQLIHDGPVYHEIAIILHQESDSDAVAADLNREFNDIIAETWMELSPELRFMTQAGGGTYMFYIMLVIMFALAFGILNTMLMAIFERMRELGMLMAVGMSKIRVFMMIILESIILTLTGAAGGILLAMATIRYYGTYGLDLTAVGGDTMKEWGYDAIVYPFVTPEEYLSVTLLVAATAMAAAIYPAIKALRLNPGEVVRE